MSEAARQARASADVRNYMLFCFGALLFMVPILLEKEMGLWSIFPLVIGALSLMAHWRAGPVFLLVVLAVLTVLKARGLDPMSCLENAIDFGALPPVTAAPYKYHFRPVPDFLLALCVLAFVAGHYRLQALVYQIVEPERRPGDKEAAKLKVPPKANVRRAVGLMASREIPLLAAAALAATVAAEGVANFFEGLKPTLSLWAFDGLTVNLHMWPGGWRAMVFCWAFAMILLASWGAAAYVRRRLASREESLMYLQDQLWLATRHEQARLNRWRAWEHLRAQRRKEGER
jgi:hypothetical protein